MKVTYTTADGRLRVEFEVASDKELFRRLAHFQEIYEDTPSARIDGKLVSGGNISYRVRKSKYTDEKGKEKEAEYFEKLVTTGDLKWFKKSYGVLDDGTDNLFPKRKVDLNEGDESSYVIGDDGWHKYVPPKK